MSTPIYHFDIEQNTPEWDAIRAGKWSASRAATIMGGSDTKGLDDYVMDVAWGRVHGPIEHSTYKSAAMERGSNLEPDTRDRYGFMTDRVIDTCGFVEHAEIPNVGWSPDGLVGYAHGIEAKNFLHKAYMEVIRTQRIPAEYRWQVKWAMWVGQLHSMDFLCDHPKAGLIILPVIAPTQLEIEQMEERVYLLEKRASVWMDMLLSKGT